VEGQEQFCSHLETLLNRVGVAGHLGADNIAFSGQVSPSHLQLLPQHVTNGASLFHKKTNIAIFNLQSKNYKLGFLLLRIIPISRSSNLKEIWAKMKRKFSMIRGQNNLVTLKLHHFELNLPIRLLH
jgi:hypothetical protein